MTESLPTTCSSRLRRLRPVLALALGLLGFGPTQAQLRPASPADRAQPQEVLTSAPGSPAARLLVPSAPVSRPLALISSTAAGGNWSAPATWVGGVVPTASDDVTIVAGATVTLDVAAVAGSLTVNAGGTLGTSATAAYSLQVGGNVTNNGTMALSASATVGSDLRFVGAGSVTFGGTGTTDLYTMSLAKSVLADVVDMNLPTLSVKTSATAGTGFLSTRITTNTVDDMTGTLKISGTATITNRVFGNAAAYFIPATGAFWLSNPNYTVTGQTATPTVNGQLRLTAGTYNVGTVSGNSLLFGANSVLTVEGGTLSATGRIGNFTSATAVTGAITFTQSGGALNVATVGNASGTPSLGLAGNLTISGGTINLVQRSTATTPLDYYVAQYAATNTVAITGGTLNVGTAATATNFDFRIRGFMPNLTVDNTTNAKTALLANTAYVYGNTLITSGAILNLNAFILLAYGPAFTNNGTLTGSVAGSTLYMAGNVAQTVGGTGTYSLLRTLSVDNSSAGGVTLGVPLVVYRVNMFTGNLAGTSNLTIGDGTTVLFVVQIGVASNPNTSGSFASAPTFNLGTGAYLLIYAQEATARTTGLEVPATRVVDGVTIANTSGVTLSGGSLTINTSGVYAAGTLTLTSGNLTTSAASTVIIGAAATTLPTGSATSYVRGPEGIIVNGATAVNRTFAVGDATGWRPVVVGGITTSSTQTFTATVVSGATGGSVSGGLSSLNPTRYVRLQNTASLPASATVQLSYGADDVVGGTATAVVAQAPTATGAYASRGGAAATTPTTGIFSTLNITPGNDFFVLANTEGGTLTSSVTTGCAGATSGTLTLSGNAAGSTVVRYEANTGSGFVAVAGTNTGTTYAFTNLTTTTTFQAVLTTSDGRTVTSAPVTVTVTPTAASGFSYPAGPYCTSGTTNPTPTVTGATGGTFTSTTGLTINATTGVITLSSSTAGTYTVTYTSGGACPSSSTQSVTINAAPTAGFSYAGAPFCVSGTTNPTPTLATGATGGTFISTTGLTLAANGTITLSTSTPGTYTVTNTVAAANGCAAVTSTATVAINAAPTAGFLYPATTNCAGTATTLTPTLATGATAGTFSLPAATGLTINATTGAVTVAATAAAGTYTVTNTVAAANGCAAVISTASFVLSGPSTAGFSYSGSPFCKSGTNPTPTITGTAGGTFTSTTGLTLNATTGTITLSSSTAGIYTVTYTVAGACGSSSTQTVTITNPSTANFSYPTTTVCAGTATTLTPALATGATAGTFTLPTATGLSINATTGVVTVAATAAAGTYTVTNTIAANGGCAAVSSTASFILSGPSTAGFSYAGSPFCTTGTNPTPTITGTAGGTFSSTTGLTINATTGAITLGSSTAGTYTVTYTVAGTCGSSSTQTVTITAPATAGFSYPTTTNCAGTTTTLTPTLATGATAGTFSLPTATGLTVNATTGAVTVAATATAGTYTVTNTIAASGGCAAATSTATFTIAPQTTATFSYAGAPFCVSGTTNPTPTITGTAGGTFSSATGLSLNTSTGAITLNTSTPGTYTVTYTVAGTCGSSSTQTVTITAPQSAGFAYTGGTICAGVTTTFTPVLATGATAGTFTVPAAPGISVNATTGVVSVGSTAAAGTYTVTNTVAASGGCAAATSTASFTLTPVASGTANYGATTFCTTGPNPTPTITGTTGGTFSATPTGLSIAAGSGTINLSASTPGTYTVLYTIVGACGSGTSQTITITAAPTAGFSYPTPGLGAACAGGTGTFAPVLATGATAGTFSATTGLSINATTGVISLAGSAAGTYTITNTVAASGGCAAVTSTTTFTVNPVPATPTLTATGTPATGITLTSSATGNNQFYLNGVAIPGATGQTLLINSGQNNGAYTVVVTSAAGCSSARSAAVNVTVTGTAPTQAGTSLALYPNPTRDGLLTLELSGYREAVQLTVSNALGQRVYEGTVAAGQLTQALPLTHLPTGLYVLQARTASGGVEVRRIVRE